MNKKKFGDYQERLLQRLLDNEEFAAEYLSEALRDEDPRILVIALNNIIQAQDKNLATLAEEAHMSRMSLYRITAHKSMPKLTSLIPLLNAVGFELSARPVKGK